MSHQTLKSFAIRRQTSLGRNRFGHRSGSDLRFRGEFLPFFIKPNLKIISIDTDQNIDTRWGELKESVTYWNEEEAEIPYTTYPLRRFVKITVKNTGQNLATNCEITSRLLGKSKGCVWLSGEEKRLCWEDGDIQKTIAKGHTASFHLAFSQENITRTQKQHIGNEYCDILNTKAQAYAWMATRNALQNPEHRTQDGLCQGEFRIHVEVFTEYGNDIRSDFIIKAGNGWQTLNAEQQICRCFQEPWWRRILRRLKP